MSRPSPPANHEQPAARPLSKSTSKRRFVFSCFRYLFKDLDGTRSYFLASDIADFEQYRFKLDEALSRGDMTPAFTIYNRFQQRINERLSFLVKELKANASTYKFDTNERLELDRDKAQWATTSAELDDLWRKRLKNAILNLQSAGKEPKAAIELLQNAIKTSSTAPIRLNPMTPLKCL